MWPLIGLGISLVSTIAGHASTISAIKDKANDDKLITLFNAAVDKERLARKNRIETEEAIVDDRGFLLSSPSHRVIEDFNENEYQKTLLRNTRITEFKLKNIDKTKSAGITAAWIKTIGNIGTLTYAGFKTYGAYKDAQRGMDVFNFSRMNSGYDYDILPKLTPISYGTEFSDVLE